MFFFNHRTKIKDGWEVCSFYWDALLLSSCHQWGHQSVSFSITARSAQKHGLFSVIYTQMMSCCYRELKLKLFIQSAARLSSSTQYRRSCHWLYSMMVSFNTVYLKGSASENIIKLKRSI